MKRKKQTGVRSGGVNLQGRQVDVGRDAIGRDNVGRDKIDVTINEAAQAPVIPALHQLPAPPDDFTGREES
jgi:hypothetical protein